MQTSAFASPIALLKQKDSQCKRQKLRQYPPRIPPSRCTRVQPAASAHRNEREVPSKKSTQISRDEATYAKQSEDGADKRGAGLFARDFQRIRESFQSISSNAADEDAPSPVRSRFLKTLLERIMRIQTVVEETTEQFQLQFPLPRLRNPSEALPGSATRRFMRIFDALKLPGSGKGNEEWQALAYFQWQKVDTNAALPPSEARRIQRKQRRNMLDGIAEVAPNAWRIALQTGGKAVDSIIQSSIDGTRRHNEAAARMRLRKKEVEIARPRKSSDRKPHKNGNRRIANVAHAPKTQQLPNAAHASDVFNPEIGKDSAKKKPAPPVQRKTYTKKKKTKAKNNNLNGKNEMMTRNAVKLAHSFINPTPRKGKGTSKKARSTGDEKKEVSSAESTLSSTNGDVWSKIPTANNKSDIGNRGESIVDSALNFADSLINPASKKSELIAGKWTLDSYAARLFFAAMGALAAKSLLITITPLVTLVSHAYIISEAQAPRKMPREMLNAYIRRKSRAVWRVDEFVRNYQQVYEQRRKYNYKHQRLLPPMNVTEANLTINSNNYSSNITGEEVAVETVARQVGASTPAILNAPVLGEVLQGFDSVAYSVENSWKRMKKMTGVRKSSTWENDQWILLQSLEWQREEREQGRERR